MQNFKLVAILRNSSVKYYYVRQKWYCASLLVLVLYILPVNNAAWILDDPLLRQGGFKL